MNVQWRGKERQNPPCTSSFFLCLAPSSQLYWNCFPRQHQWFQAAGASNNLFWVLCIVLCQHLHRPMPPALETFSSQHLQGTEFYQLSPFLWTTFSSQLSPLIWKTPIYPRKPSFLCLFSSLIHHHFCLHQSCKRIWSLFLCPQNCLLKWRSLYQAKGHTAVSGWLVYETSPNLSKIYITFFINQRAIRFLFYKLPNRWHLNPQPGIQGHCNMAKACLLRFWNSHCGSVVTNPTSIHEDAGSIPGLAQWVKDLALLWAVVQVADAARIPHCSGCGLAPIWPRAWEPPYAMGAALKHTHMILFPLHMQ